MPGRTEGLLQLWSPCLMPAVSPKITAAFTLLSNTSIPQVDASVSLEGRRLLSLHPDPNIQPSRATVLSRRKDRKLSLLSTQGSRLPTGGLGGKEYACNIGDLGSTPGSGRSPGEGNSRPLRYSCLENSTDRGAWRAVVQRVAKNWT